MTPRPASETSAWAPLTEPGFRLLWIMWLLSNLSMWMSNVAAAWAMAQLPVSALWVAMVQVASSLPVFMFSLPMGALADRVDPRRILLWTQVWLAVAALVPAVLGAWGELSALMLVAVTFAYACGFAMRSPVYFAILPDVVARDRLPEAVALNSTTMHLSRVVGPLSAGLLIGLGGTSAVFAVVALLALVSTLLMLRWQPPVIERPPVTEPFMASMRTGAAFCFRSPALRGNLARVFVFFAFTAPLPALLPLAARRMDGADAGTFTALLAWMGAGAIASIPLQRPVRGRLSADARVLAGMSVFSGAMVVLALTRSTPVACLAMFTAGASMLMLQATLNVAIQLGLPAWVRARGMAIQQMAFLGSGALGAAVWGQFASMTSVPASLVAGAVLGVLVMALVVRRLPATD